MFNQETVISALLPLVGWRKDTNTAITANQNPMGDLLTASAGLYYNDQHPLLTMDMLRSIADVFDDYTYAAWSSGTTYAKGDIVSGFYVSLQNGNLNNATSDATYWRLTNPFSEWLRNKTIAGITQCLNDWYHKKGKVRTAKNLLRRAQVLDIPGIRTTPVSETTGYMGWYVLPSPVIDLATTIDRVYVHHSGGANFNLLLFRNGSATPIATKAVTGSDYPQWIETNWTLDRGNFYYVAYNREAIGAGIPVNGIVNYDKGNWPYGRFPGTYPFCEVGSFAHEGPSQSGWQDVTAIVNNASNYGLNLSLSARCDYTELVVDQKTLFAPVAAKSVALMLLRELAFNPKSRINRSEANVDTQTLLYEIDGDSQGREGGIRKMYKDALKDIAFDWSRLSKHCSECRSDKIQIGTT